MARKKAVAVGRCFVCDRKHYSHLSGWVFNGNGKLLCYELDYTNGELRTDCFEKAKEKRDPGMGLECNRKGLRTVSSEELLRLFKANMEKDLQR